jgi:hypothetical protein
MTPKADTSTNAADKTKSVKATWDKAPAGPKKHASPKHCQGAQKAHTAKNDPDTHKSIDAAAHALK